LTEEIRFQRLLVAQNASKVMNGKLSLIAPFCRATSSLATKSRTQLRMLQLQQIVQ